MSTGVPLQQSAAATPQLGASALRPGPTVPPPAATALEPATTALPPAATASRPAATALEPAAAGAQRCAHRAPRLRAALRLLGALCLLLCGQPAWAQPLPTIAEAVDLDPDPAVLKVELTAAPLPADHPARRLGYRWAYNGQIPGPTLRAAVGTTLHVRVRNALDQPTSVHWHGAGAPYPMDGAPLDPAQLPEGLQLSAQAPQAIPPGGEFTYQFPLERIGTFWYHPHFNTDRQVDAGLYGALIVTEDTPSPAQEAVLIFDVPDEPAHDLEPPSADAPQRRADTAPPPTLEGLRDARAAAGLGHRPTETHWHINGAPTPGALPLDGRPLHLRVLNVSGTRYLALRLPGLVSLAAGQGQRGGPVHQQPYVIGPGQRAEFTVSPPTPSEGESPHTAPTEDPRTLHTEIYSLNGGLTFADPLPLIELTGPLPTSPLATPQPQPPSADPPHTDLLYVLSGSDRTGQQLINGYGFPHGPVDRIAPGQRPIIEVRNLSSSHHPFHIHGHRFEVLSINGRPPPTQRWTDTLDIPIHARVRLRLEPARPGLWMVHCHLLPHAEGGMMTLLEVR